MLIKQKDGVMTHHRYVSNTLNINLSSASVQKHEMISSPVKPYTSIPLSLVSSFRCEDTCTGSWIVYLNSVCMLVCVLMCAWACASALYSIMYYITCCK